MDISFGVSNGSIPDPVNNSPAGVTALAEIGFKPVIFVCEIRPECINCIKIRPPDA